uniref:Uncharacterized protein n=1 Tax=Chromera velia CCMP2878 TaxID=1169474 RepID=A0A0G4HK87_9ALVE|eukprot:Cvel_7247.t1-p1 / transcript=Cvel_7247.t1 / gene=Cvel_7247 / organism=Chromera_velia_CCMP2878 / gene_product=hypothetical protein / transcript_product=hypothetical protein / location=Cvel_scaffold374:18618-24595(+) / protein_length=484 / sequence_SO=supercontig / SO=protein_coding / is_pseudo=false
MPDCRKMLEFGADPDSHNSSGQLPFIPPHLLEHLEVRQLGGNRNEGEGEETGVILTGGGDVKDKKGPTIEAVAQEAEAEDAELLEELAREEERIRKEEQQRAEELEEENKRKQEEERLAAEIQAAAEASRQEVEQQATATAAAENAQTNNEGQEAEDPAGATEGEGVEQQNDEKEGEPPTLEKGATQGTDKLTAALGEGQDGDKEGEGPSEILKPQRSAQLSEAPGGGQKTRPTSEASSSDAGSEGEDDEGDQRPVTGHSSDDEHYPGPEEAQEGPEDTKEEQKPSIDPKKAAALAFLKEQEVMEKESEELLRTTTEAAKSHESLQEDNALLERRVAFLLWKGANQHKGEQAGGAQGQGTAGTGAGPASSRMGAPPTEEKKLEEKREKTQRAADAFNIFRRTMIDNAVYSLSGKPIPKAVVQMLEDLSAAKDGEVEQHRGAVVALQNRFRRLDKSLKLINTDLLSADYAERRQSIQELNEKVGG